MALGDTVSPPAFSNHSEWSVWQHNYCRTCWHDRAARQGREEDGCSWIALGMARQVVPGWVEAEPPQFVHCLAWTPDDGGPDEAIPEPPPQCPGQLSIDDDTEDVMTDARADEFPAPAVEVVQP